MHVISCHDMISFLVVFANIFKVDVETQILCRLSRTCLQQLEIGRFELPPDLAINICTDASPLNA